MIIIDFLHCLQGNQDGNFNSRLFRLLMKADPHNMERLRKSFPLETTMMDIHQKGLVDMKEFACLEGQLQPYVEKVLEMAKKMVEDSKHG